MVDLMKNHEEIPTLPIIYTSLASRIALTRLHVSWILQEVFLPVTILTPFLSPGNKKNIHNLDCRISSFTDPNQ